MYRVNYGWLHGSVRPYFENNGVVLLKDDVLFIEKCLSFIPPERHRRVMSDYFKIWTAAIPDYDIVKPEAYNGRYEANTYLRNASSPPDD